MSGPVINSHDSWSQLEEAWLGDVYPSSWYDHLDPAVRDVFYHLTEITQADLSVIQGVMQDLGICVRRPHYHCIDHFVDSQGHLVKPAICPRDHNLVIGNTLYRLAQPGADPWHETIDLYRQDPRVEVVPAPALCINGANVVRVGRDIVIDRDSVTDYNYHNDWPDHRVQVVSNGGHLDGCFAILKPGLILANHYWSDYATTFPGWHVIRLDDPVYQAAPAMGFQQPYPIYNGKFWDTAVGINRTFNQHIIDHALDWVGCYTETYFELNCLVVNTENVIMLAENEALARELERHGIQVHWVPFRARSFWDGAMHCLTVDIRRQSAIVDYFPEREQAWH